MFMKSLVRLLVIGVLSVQASIALAGWEFDWEKAVSLYKQGQYQAAIVEFQGVVAEYPNHADSWKFIGLAYFQLQAYDKAIPPLEKALSLKQAEGKTDQDIVVAITRARLSLKQYDQALPFLENLAKTRPDVAANHYLLGVAYANMNRSADAIASFQRALKIAPKDTDSWYYLALQQFRLEKTNDAIVSLRNGLLASPGHIEMSGLLAEALLRQAEGETSEAKKSALSEEAVKVATALKAARDDGPSAELLGRSLLAAKKYLPAEQMLSRAAAMIKPAPPGLFFNLGLAQAQLKTWPKALDSFLNADRANPNDLNTLYYLGFVYENLRQFQQALDSYSRAYELSGKTNADIKASMDRVAPFAKP